MSEMLNEPSEDDARDWMASEFQDADYISDGELDQMIVEVADGTQDETADDDEGWALAPDDEESFSEGGL